MSVSPATVLSGSTISNFQVTGSNLTAATFAFLPTFSPAAITVSNVNIGSGGTSATMSLSLAAGAVGSFTLVGTNSSGSSTAVASPNNTLTLLSSDPSADSDGDGLTNLYKTAVTSNPTNPSTTNDGIPDGWALFYGLSPLNAAAASQTAPDGLTYLQAFQRGVNPGGWPTHSAFVISDTQRAAKYTTRVVSFVGSGRTEGCRTLRV